MTRSVVKLLLVPFLAMLVAVDRPAFAQIVPATTPVANPHLVPVGNPYLPQRMVPVVVPVMYVEQPDAMVDPFEDDPSAEEGAGDPESSAEELADIDESVLYADSVAICGPVVFDTNVSFIDTAVVGSQVRLRYDQAWEQKRIDRAEFFNGMNAALGGSRGLAAPDPTIDYQDVRTYAELAVSHRLSFFAELPYRFINPTVNLNYDGLTDVTAGFKLGIIANECTSLTFQMKTYIPTGDGAIGLGTEHYTIEPGLLLRKKLMPRWTIEAELSNWIPIDGSLFTNPTRDPQLAPFENRSYSGNIFRYGLGTGLDLINDGNGRRLTAVSEFIGWTIMDGLTFDRHPISGALAMLDVSGDTIVNSYVGLRYTTVTGSSLYGGFGRPLTGQEWYSDIARFEYNIRF